MNILYGTDGSDCASIAGRLLASLPLPADTRITVLSAVAGNDSLESMICTDTSVREHRLALAHAEDGIALLGECGAPVVSRTGGGDAALALLKRAEADHIDLIVVGCHGRGAVGRLLVPSVSEHVARYALTSVLVARRDRIERIIAGVDGSESSEHAIEALTRLPLPAEIPIHLVYVAPARGSERPDLRDLWLGYETPAAPDKEEPPGMAERIVSHAAQRLRAAGRPAEVEIRRGAPAEQLIEAARETKADLVVVGSSNRSALGRLFLGSVSARVLGHAPCSVLVARLAPVPAAEDSAPPELAGATA